MSRKPDYNLCVKPKNGPGVNNRVGAAWKDEQGRISIKLNPCVVISHLDDVWIGLFPAEKPQYNKSYQSYEDPHPPVDFDDDVPF